MADAFNKHVALMKSLRPRELPGTNAPVVSPAFLKPAQRWLTLLGSRCWSCLGILCTNLGHTFVHLIKNKNTHSKSPVDALAHWDGWWDVCPPDLIRRTETADSNDQERWTTDTLASPQNHVPHVPACSHHSASSALRSLCARSALAHELCITATITTFSRDWREMAWS